MACQICRMSCSLCPYCGTATCPNYSNDESTIDKYSIYATDRKGSYYVEIYNTNSKQDLTNTLNKIKEGKFKKSWARKFKYCLDLGKEIDYHYPNCKTYYKPLIELCITVKDNWNTALNLVYDIDKKELYHYKGDFTYHCESVKIGKPWNGKVTFRSKR